MKKITVFAVALLAISFVSCKKDRTCTCTSTNNNGDVVVQEKTFTEIKKGDAKDACSDRSYSYTSDGNTSTSKVECELK